ncbi:hypothetical protein Q9R08_14840 [Microbacterium sp. QXD-8]|uniref:Uncharacterized protein n=1 Tax=Microbacterium psychrotolerans TaxID=3068321 RepID=A0ABU0Z3V8_9MICO|nr:hypothetical protein [Microbacterium sp. QXD-8]MDQ7879264.1 hypothetical protein [Microbacterium sp. QXD-8]
MRLPTGPRRLGVITIIVDLFRDHTLNGWGSALWVIFLVTVPFLAAPIAVIECVAPDRSVGWRHDGGCCGSASLPDLR